MKKYLMIAGLCLFVGSVSATTYAIASNDVPVEAVVDGDKEKDKKKKKKKKAEAKKCQSSCCAKKKV